MSWIIWIVLGLVAGIVAKLIMPGRDPGGIDNGAPGPRGPAEMKYYAAFALDPDGNNVEAGVRE